MWAWLCRLFGPPGQPAVPPLALQTHNPDPDVRLQAVKQLGVTAAPRAATELVALLGDTHTPIREASATALLGLGAAAGPALVAGLNHPSQGVARQSAELLGELRLAEAIQPLLVALKFSPRPVQMAARRALVRIGAAAMPALEEAARDSEPWVRQQATEALAEMRATSTSQA